MDFLVLLLTTTVETPQDSFNSPGLVGFLATFAVAVGATLLFIDMNRRVRRTKYREDIRERLALEELSDFDPNAKPQRPKPPSPPNRAHED